MNDLCIRVGEGQREKGRRERRKILKMVFFFLLRMVIINRVGRIEGKIMLMNLWLDFAKEEEVS